MSWLIEAVPEWVGASPIYLWLFSLLVAPVLTVLGLGSYFAKHSASSKVSIGAFGVAVWCVMFPIANLLVTGWLFTRWVAVIVEPEELVGRAAMVLLGVLVGVPCAAELTGEVAAVTKEDGARTFGYVGTEWDWMTFYYNLNRDATSPWTIDDLGALYTTACGGWCGSNDNDAFDFTKLDAAAKMLYPDLNSPKYQQFVFHGTQSGVGTDLSK